jgi:hypothetical protein
MISDTEKLALVRASKDLTVLELIEATCEACKATFITSDIARAEREACALVCIEHAVDGSEGEWDTCCEYLADRIRDRGKV